VCKGIGVNIRFLDFCYVAKCDLCADHVNVTYQLSTTKPLEFLLKNSIKVRYKNLSIKSDFCETRVRESHDFISGRNWISTHISHISWPRLEKSNAEGIHLMLISIYIYMCVCVCVHFCEDRYNESHKPLYLWAWMKFRHIFHIFHLIFVTIVKENINNTWLVIWGL